MPESESPRKVNMGLLVGGGAVIAVSAVGAYYIYSGNVLIDDYMKLLEDYEREYKDFIADGVLDEDEKAMLQPKRDALVLLGKKIEEHGLLNQLKGILAQVKGIIVEGGPWIIAIIVIRWIVKKYRPPGPYKCPKCGREFPSEWRLKRHIERDHAPKPQEQPEAHDAWDGIQDLPDWLIEVIALVSGLKDTLWDYIGKAVTEIPPEHWALIILAVLVSIVIAIFAPALLPLVAAAI